MVTHDEAEVIGLADSSDALVSVFEHDFKNEQIAQFDQTEISEQDFKALKNKRKCLTEMSIQHLAYVRIFFGGKDGMTRAIWEERRYIFLRISLQILAALRELLNSAGIEQLKADHLITLVTIRREITRCTTQLLIELGPFEQVSPPVELISGVKEFYSVCEDTKRLSDMLPSESGALIDQCVGEERLLSDILDFSVPLWPSRFLRLAQIPTNICRMGDELNLDLTVNLAVENINEMLAKYGATPRLLRLLLQYRLNSLIRARRPAAGYLLLLHVFLADPAKCFVGDELAARRRGQVTNSILQKFCPPQMLAQLVEETQTYRYFLTCLSSFNLKSASFVNRLNLQKCFSQFRNAGYNFSATLARSLPLLPACDSVEEAIRSSLQRSSTKSLLLYHYTNARYPTRIFLDRQFMHFLSMALSNTKLLISLVIEMWHMDDTLLPHIVNLQKIIRLQTVTRVLTLGLRSTKSKREHLRIIGLIHRLFCDFPEVQFSTGIALLSNLKRNSHDQYVKHVLHLVKVMEGWSMESFNCVRVKWKQQRGMLFSGTRIRPYFKESPKSILYVHDSNINMLVLAIEESEVFPPGLQDKSDTMDYLAFFTKLFALCESRIGKMSVSFYEKLGEHLSEQHYIDQTNRAETFNIQGHAANEVRSFCTERLAVLRPAQSVMLDFKPDLKIEAKSETVDVQMGNRPELVMKHNFNFPQLSKDVLDIHGVV